jgi:hypothetical protein
MPESPPTSTPPGFGAGAAAKPLYCKIQLDKNQGFILEILDAQGMNQQSITLDGTTLTMKVQGPMSVSTITQTANTVSINAKEVNIDAESVRVTSRASTSLQSLGQTNVSSISEITLQTPARVVLQAMQGVDINTMSLSVNALQDIALQALGGVAVFGIGSGVQLFGSSVNVTGLEVSLTALLLKLLAFGVTVAPPGGG